MLMKEIYMCLVLQYFSVIYWLFVNVFSYKEFDTTNLRIGRYFFSNKRFETKNLESEKDYGQKGSQSVINDTMYV